MGFLNEIQLKYPQAISLASGRPDENYFEIQDFPEYFDAYVESVSLLEGKSRDTVLKSLGQYNKTKGIISSLVTKYLQKDEKINADPEDILITVGTQEALAIAIMTICDKAKDIIIVEDPSYVGITHLSIIAGYQVEPITVRPDGMSMEMLEEKILYLETIGKKVKIVYVVPDFQNPTGISMSKRKRIKLLELAVKYGFFILEDNAYGDYSYDGAVCSPIKVFDENRRVIYMRSFAKTIYPSLRIGVMVADQMIGNAGAEERLSDLMAKTKGYLTINTSSINQAILGGMLIRNKYSLKGIAKAKVKSIKNKRDLFLAYLDKYVGSGGNGCTRKISWSIPQGGFFLTIRVPFEVNKEEVITCAEQYQVIFTPMSFFYFNRGGENEIRIAFSNIPDEKIGPAVRRLMMYFKSKL